MPPQTTIQQGDGAPMVDAAAQMSAAASAGLVTDLASPAGGLPKAAAAVSARGVPLSLRARCR